MKMILIAVALAVSMSGCAQILAKTPLAKLPLSSNPLASALRQCAMIAEILTPGINLSAVAELSRVGGADNALGNTPQGAMRNCAGLMDTIAD